MGHPLIHQTPGGGFLFTPGFDHRAMLLNAILALNAGELAMIVSWSAVTCCAHYMPRDHRAEKQALGGHDAHVRGSSLSSLCPEGRDATPALLWCDCQRLPSLFLGASDGRLGAFLFSLWLLQTTSWHVFRKVVPPLAISRAHRCSFCSGFEDSGHLFTTTHPDPLSGLSTKAHTKCCIWESKLVKDQHFHILPPNTSESSCRVVVRYCHACLFVPIFLTWIWLSPQSCGYEWPLPR